MEGPDRGDRREEVAAFLASFPEEERVRLGRYMNLELPGDTQGIARVLGAYGEENTEATLAELLAITGAQAAFAGDEDLGLRISSAALELSETDGEKQLAHVSLAQIHHRNRRDPQELERFESHCLEAIRLGHSGTFCYERLAVLYEYRGEKEEAARICRRAIEVLEEAGDTRSAQKFQKRLGRISSG